MKENINSFVYYNRTNIEKNKAKYKFFICIKWYQGIMYFVSINSNTFTS